MNTLLPVAWGYLPVFICVHYSVFAAVTWIIASFLFSWYLASFANYNATY
jgi:uncharacterized BrkB/YihY/UPF0761 family membrane protein